MRDFKMDPIVNFCEMILNSNIILLFSCYSFEIAKSLWFFERNIKITLDQQNCSKIISFWRPAKCSHQPSQSFKMLYKIVSGPVAHWFVLNHFAEQIRKLLSKKVSRVRCKFDPHLRPDLPMS